MRYRHRARVAPTHHVRRARTRPQVSWILLGMLFVTAVLLSSPQFNQAGTNVPDPVRDLDSSVPAGAR